MRHSILLVIPFFVLLPILAVDAQTSFETIETYPAEEVFQAVAVDSDHFYAIDSRAIGKYDKETGNKVDQWQASTDGPILTSTVALSSMENSMLQIPTIPKFR